MNKTKFLKEAQEKYKNACEKKFVAEMNFIFSSELILRVWFDVNYDPNNKEGDTGYRHRWCTVNTLPCQADQDVIKRLGEITSADGNDDSVERDEAIIEYLRSIEGETLHESAHGHEFELNGKKYEIVMWENCDHFTLEQVCEYIGI